MPKKSFDLMPPYTQKETHHHPGLQKKKEKKKARRTFGMVVLFLFLVVFLGGVLEFDKSGFKLPGKNSSAPKPSSSSNSSSFELFDNQGQSNLTNIDHIKVSILDGGGNAEKLRVAKDLLLKKGYVIANVTAAATASPQTIVYYPEGKQIQAQTIADTLKTSFNITIELLDKTSPNYDFLILLGGS